MDNVKILLAEDDIDFGNMLTQYLILNKYEVVHALNGAEAWERFCELKFDICILDVMMPEMDGYKLSEKIKFKKNDCPVIFLTAKGLKEDKLKGLKIGADDYITKPFDPDELILRIHNILKRYSINRVKKIELSSSILYYDRMVFECNQQEHILTSKERDLMFYLMENKNKVVSRKGILTSIWGEDDYFLGRSMDVFISRIRKYFSADCKLKLRTVRGEGFILETID